MPLISDSLLFQGLDVPVWVVFVGTEVIGTTMLPSGFVINPDVCGMADELATAGGD